MNKETTTSTQTTTTTTTTDHRPLWQQISGIDPATESEMSRAERNAALRKLITEATERAKIEFAAEDDGSIPDGERTIFWDPMHRVCMELGISRTKLSAYSRELTGMRAHEISDRILAKRKLIARLTAHVEYFLQPELESMHKQYVEQNFDMGVMREEAMGLVRWLKSLRKKERAASFAAEMGFANFSRLNRACLLAFGISLDQLESEMVCTHVQKFFEGLEKEQKTETPSSPRRQERQEHPKEEEVEPELTDEEKIAGDRIIKEVVEQMLGIKKAKMQVA